MLSIVNVVSLCRGSCSMYTFNLNRNKTASFVAIYIATKMSLPAKPAVFFPPLHLLLLAPGVLLFDLLLFLRREVVDDVECLPDLLWRLAFDHVGHSFAAHVQESLINIILEVNTEH